MNRPLSFRRAAVSALALAVCAITAAPADDAQHAALIGKRAPDFKPGFTLNGKATNLADLKGKVVLMDFWAVWCGPCVRTFPHLKEWNSAYKDKGLEIIGITTYYEKLGFDKDKGKLIQVKEDLSAAKEQAMLKDFAEYHKLPYRLMALPKDEIKTLYKEYKVTGIPQVVLVDRKGVVRLVKVGAGEDTAREIEKMLKTLVAEK